MDFKPNHLAKEEITAVKQGNEPCKGFVRLVLSHPFLVVAVLCLACTVLTTSTALAGLLPIFALIPTLIILIAGVPAAVYFSTKSAQSDESRKKMAMFMSLAAFAGAIVIFFVILKNGSLAFHLMNYG